MAARGVAAEVHPLRIKAVNRCILPDPRKDFRELLQVLPEIALRMKGIVAVHNGKAHLRKGARVQAVDVLFAGDIGAAVDLHDHRQDVFSRRTDQIQRMARIAVIEVRQVVPLAQAFGKQGRAAVFHPLFFPPRLVPAVFQNGLRDRPPSDHGALVSGELTCFPECAAGEIAEDRFAAAVSRRQGKVPGLPVHVAHDKKSVFLRAPFVGQHAFRAAQRNETALGAAGLGLAEGKQFPVEVQHGIPAPLLLRSMDPAEVFPRRDPRPSGGKTGIRAAVPLHGRPGVVPGLERHDLHGFFCAQSLFEKTVIAVEGLDVPQILTPAEIPARHGQLLPLIDKSRAAHEIQQCGEHLGRALAQRPRVADPAYDAGLVVIAPEQGTGRSVLQAELPADQHAFEFLAVDALPRPLIALASVQSDMLELKGHVELLPLREAVGQGILHRDRRGLSDGHEAERPEDFAVQLAQIVVDRSVVGHSVVKVCIAAAVGLSVRRKRRLGDQADRVETEAVGPLSGPEAQDVLHGLAHGRIPPVQIGLRRAEQAQIVFPALFVVVPGAAAELAAPVVRLFAPEVPAPFFRAAGRTAFAKPGVFRRAVVQHHVQDHPQAQRVCLFHQGPEILLRAVLRIDPAIVRDIIAVVDARALEKGRDPKRVGAERADIRQLLADAVQIPYAVAVGIEKAADVDLIDDRVFPAEGAHASLRMCFLKNARIGVTFSFRK